MELVLSPRAGRSWHSKLDSAGKLTWETSLAIALAESTKDFANNLLPYAVEGVDEAAFWILAGGAAEGANAVVRGPGALWRTPPVPGGKEPLMLSPSRPRWSGKIMSYGGGGKTKGMSMSALEHIYSRHVLNAAAHTSYFNRGTTYRNIIDLVNETIRKGEYEFNKHGCATIRFGFQHSIGTDKFGMATNWLEVHVNKLGDIRTAYPISAR